MITICRGLSQVNNNNDGSAMTEFLLIGFLFPDIVRMSDGIPPALGERFSVQAFACCIVLQPYKMLEELFPAKRIGSYGTGALCRLRTSKT